jgi:hypothetical protein
MKPTLALGLALIVAALPLAAAAQSQSPATGDLEIQKKQKRAVVLPKPSPEQARADADRAVTEYASGRTPGQVVRDTSPVRPSSRPDLDYDVKSGIQTRQLQKELKGK